MKIEVKLSKDELERLKQLEHPTLYEKAILDGKPLPLANDDQLANLAIKFTNWLYEMAMEQNMDTGDVEEVVKGFLI